MMRRAMVIGGSAMVLAACGGGGDAPAAGPAPIAFYANSVGTSYLIVRREGDPERLAVPFARRLQDLSGRAVLDYSANGATASGLLAGAARMSSGPFAQHVAKAPAGVVVLLLGGVEAVWGADPDEFAAALGELCDAALRAGKQVVLVDCYRHPAFAAAVDAINARIDAVAAARNLPVARTRDLAVTTADGLHPDSALQGSIVLSLLQPLKGLP
jgi:hypothetical protein